MSEERMKAFDHYRTASQQFDYFVLGITGALVAYTIQHLQPQRLSLSPYGVEIGALSILIVSLLVGLKSIETLIELMKINIKRLEKQDSHSTLVKALAELRHDPLMVTRGGKMEIIDRQTATQMAQRLEVETDAFMEVEETLAIKGGRLYRVRNRLLILGFVLLAVSRVIEPYFAKPQ
jgi:hypothetical protein